MKSYVAAKIHGIRVTAKSVKYHGSIGVSRTLLDAVGIEPYEKVHVVNLTNGARWTTYAIPLDEEGAFSLNGGGARLGEHGDECVIMTYVQSPVFRGAPVIHLDDKNHIVTRLRYDAGT